MPSGRLLLPVAAAMTRHLALVASRWKSRRGRCVASACDRQNRLHPARSRDAACAGSQAAGQGCGGRLCAVQAFSSATADGVGFEPSRGQTAPNLFRPHPPSQKPSALQGKTRTAPCDRLAIRQFRRFRTPLREGLLRDPRALLRYSSPSVRSTPARSTPTRPGHSTAGPTQITLGRMRSSTGIFFRSSPSWGR